MQPPQAVSFQVLQRILSPARLAAYQTRPDDRARTVFGRYRWNMALCASIQPCLHYVEVALRNSLHRSLSGHCTSTPWYEMSSRILKPEEHQAVARARQELLGRGKPDTSDRMVAELSFGFWTRLLSRPYEGILWPRLLESAFSHMPRRRRRRVEVAQRFNRIRHLRNRISHHEPIWHWRDLEPQYNDILDALDWFEPTLKGCLPQHERFEDVYTRSSVAYEMDLIGSDGAHDQVIGAA
jgi:hypothetical protein